MRSGVRISLGLSGLRLRTAAAVIAFSFVPSLSIAQDIAAGEQQFRLSCGVCHVIDAEGAPRQGPPLRGIVGRRVASQPGFAYSSALKDADFVWDEALLDRWMTDAGAMRPGTTMSYRQADPAKRARIFAYLKSLSP